MNFFKPVRSKFATLGGVCISFCLASSAFALDGWYAGIQAGFDRPEGEFKGTSTTDVEFGPASPNAGILFLRTGSNDDFDLTNKRISGGILGGYAFGVTEDVSLGVEARLNTYSNSNLKFTNNFLDDTIRQEAIKTFGSSQTTSYSVLVAPSISFGQSCQSTQLYALAGASYGNFKINRRFQGISFLDEPIGAEFTFDTGPSNYTKDRAGYIVGFGMEQAVSENVGLRFEFTHADYGRFNLGDQTGVIIPNPASPNDLVGTVNISGDAKLTNDSVSISVLYRFGGF